MDSADKGVISFFEDSVTIYFLVQLFSTITTRIKYFICPLALNDATLLDFSTGNVGVVGQPPNAHGQLNQILSII